MEWLVAHGPLVASPPLPSWALERLVKTERILRLRRGVYLAPTSDGLLPSIEATIGLLAPGGYITGYAALILHGLTDQDTNRYNVISDTRQGNARYGQRSIRLVWSRARAASAHTVHREFDEVSVRLATPAQAVFDCLSLPSLAPYWRELVLVIRVGLQSRRLRRKELTELVAKAKSPSVARRAGFLLQVAGGSIDEQLWTLARRTHDQTDLLPDIPALATSREWRLRLPVTELELKEAAREL